MAEDQSQSDREESAIGYGQHEGCFVDYKSAPFRFEDVAQGLAATRATPSDEQSCGLVNEPGLQVWAFPKTSIDLEETLGSPDLERMLASTEGVAQHNGVALPTYSRTSLLKDLHLPLEMPELPSDPSQDLRDYLREVNEQRFGDPFAQWLPISPTKDQQDEGLRFPARAAKIHSLLLRELDCETIETSQGTVALMEELRHSSCAEAPQMNFGLSVRRSKRVDAEQVTPPLSPISTDSDCSPYKPDPKICTIDLTSEPSSPVQPDVQRLEESVQNGMIESDPPACETCIPTPSTPTLPTHAGKNNVSLGDLEVDVPLPSAAPSSDSSSVKDVFGKPGFLGNLTIEESPSDDRPVEYFFDEAFASTLEAHRSNVVMTLEQERFDPVDSIARIPVPTLDFGIDEPEWTSHVSNAEGQLRWVLSDDPGPKVFVPMPRSAAEERNLKWAPFAPSTGHVSTTEELDPLSDQARSLLILEPAPDLSSETFVRRKAGLRIERHKEEEELGAEENEEAHQKPGDERYSESAHFKPANVGKSHGEPTKPSIESLVTAVASKRRQSQTKQDMSSVLPRSNDADASNKLLSGYMEMRAVKKPKVASDVQLGSILPACPALHNHADQKLPALPAPGSAPAHEAVTLTPAPAPETIIPAEKASFIISLDLSRTILRTIESSWPQDHLIDRDFRQHDDFVWSTGSTQRTPVPSQPSLDADIALTPTVGIIVTTLQKAKQKQLPRSKDLPQLRKRVLEVSSKYETLYVLISERNNAGEYTSALHASDAEAYADFVYFTLSLQAGVTACLVPGNEKTMGKWILNWMCRYSPHALSSKTYLNAVESTWEVFFRRGGMNVFAAQVLAGAVLEKGGNQGLARLMASSQAEVLAAFGSYLGGDKGLRNLTKVLCEPWAQPDGRRYV